jgi:DNA polymerase-3 subunit beta
LKGFDWQEFPLVPYCDQVIAKISMKDLRRLTERAKTAVATDESRPILTGINLVIKDNTLTVAAADGFRLVVDSAPVTDGVEGTYLVPGRILCDFVGIADKDDEVIEIRARGEWKSKTVTDPDTEVTSEVSWYVAKFIQFASPFISVTCSILDGKFPQYEEIIPKNPNVFVTVDRKELLAGLKSALVFKKRENFPGCILRIGAEYPREELNVFAQSAELGDSEAIVKAEFIGHMVHMMINIHYLTDAVKNLTGDTVNLEFTAGRMSPLRITEDTLTQVVMPMHIGDTKDKTWTVRFVAPEAQLVADAIAEEIASEGEDA